MDLDVVVTEGLGDCSYVLTWGDEAVVIDPQRDAWRFAELAERRGARIRTVLETHVHNDYVSGAAELRALGAEIVGPEGAGYAFEHREARDADETPLGDGALVAFATPGHTPEHLAYLLRGPGGEPLALFSGGSLMVGGAGRTDLLGPERTDELTRMQFRSMRRIAELPDAVQVLPTHGAGSFCSAGPTGRERTSTIERERATNLALTETDEEAFVRRQTTGLVAFPTYYAHMAPINRAGPAVRGSVPLPPPITVEELATRLERGARLVDVRGSSAFAEAHVPGSLSIPLEPSTASYVGWLLPFGAPVVLLAPDGDSLVEATTQLWRIAWEPVGYLEGGIDAWRAAGRPTSSYPTLTIEDLVAEIRKGDVGEILDVRQRTEWDHGHLEGSRHVFVGDVPDRIGELDRAERHTVVCASGYRSSMAASLLDAAGVPVRLVARSGVPKALRLLAAS